MNAHLFKVYQLQEKEHIHACMLLGGHDDGDDLPATARKDLSATQEVDALHDSDDDEGGDSEDMDSAAVGPSREYSQKRRGPVPRGDCRSRERTQSVES